MAQNLAPILDFLRNLRANNNKQWFDANKARYIEASAAFEQLVSDVLAQFGAVDDLGGVSAKDCIFRIYRDTRFAADKSPYKTGMGALLGRGGRKHDGRSYYLHIEPEGQSMLAGGFFAPTPAELDRVRQAIASDASELKAVISSADFVRYFGAMQGETLKTAPQGYPKDHPDLALLRHKQFLAESAMSNEQVLAPDLIPHILRVFTAMKPFVSYLWSTQRVTG
jgi:uncharacterized protein (TIGR02453 family)